MGEQASAACRHRPQFVVLLIVNFVGTDLQKKYLLVGSKKFCRTLYGWEGALMQVIDQFNTQSALVMRLLDSESLLCHMWVAV